MNKEILKERMKKMKSNKGITLIALIITIVVLLILAVATIGAVRDSNIIGHAQKAGSDYTIAQEKEQIGLALNEWQLEKVIPGNTLSFFDVVNGALDDVATVVDNNNGTLTITFDKTGNAYTVTKDGGITPVTKGLTLTSTTVSIAPGATAQLTATRSGITENVTWTSANPNVVSVTSSSEDTLTATVTGVTTGTEPVIITATCGDYSATCTVTVSEKTEVVTKAYYNEGMKIYCFFSQENYITMFALGDDSVLPMINNTQLIDITNDENYNITLSENLLEEEEYKLLCLADWPMVLMVPETGSEMYMGELSGDNSATITKDYTFTTYDSNLISGYYNDSSNYEYYYGGNHNGNGVAGDYLVGIDYQNNKIKYYYSDWVNEANAWVLDSEFDFTITQNDQVLNIGVAYDTVESATITTNAQKITYKYNDTDLHAYIEDGKLYMNVERTLGNSVIADVVNGTEIDAVLSITKFIKASALPTE